MDYPFQNTQKTYQPSLSFPGHLPSYTKLKHHFHEKYYILSTKSHKLQHHTVTDVLYSTKQNSVIFKVNSYNRWHSHCHFFCTFSKDFPWSMNFDVHCLAIPGCLQSIRSNLLITAVSFNKLRGFSWADYYK